MGTNGPLTQGGACGCAAALTRDFYWQKAVVDKAHEVVGILTDSAASEE